MGQYADALATLEAARAAFVRLRLDRQVASAEMSLGLVHERMGRFAEAVAAIESARRRFAGWASLGLQLTAT